MKANEPSCNLQFINPNATITINDNIASITVIYFIENAGEDDVTDVFNTGTITFPRDFIIDNIASSNDLLTITELPGQILYNGNLGTLVPEETILVDLQFDIIGVRTFGETLISNISEVVDGQEDDITFAKTLELDIVEIIRNVTYENNQFIFSLTNNSLTNVDTSLIAAITLPNNVDIIFRNFGAFSATYTNTTNPVPTNTPLSGVNTIDLEAQTINIPPFSTVSLPVSFDLSSSGFIGDQLIYASIEEVTIHQGNNSIIYTIVLPSEKDQAVAIAKLQLLSVTEV